jgi:NADPH2:quinone reductase
MSTATATMRSAVIRRAGRVEMVDVAVPEPGPREIRVALEGCGVCGSDLPVWEGRSWFEYPREPGAPGHEGWGRVDGAGAEVTDPAVGDRVAILGYRSYAEYDVVPADRAVVLPSQLDDQPFPGEPLACAVNAFERAGVAAGDTVAVVGIGFLGALLVALAASVGARVIAISRRPTARDAARRMGAQDQLTLDDSILPRVEAMTAGAGCDVVIEAAGAQASLDLCGPLTRERGRLVIAGFHQDGPRQVDMQLWNWRGLDVVNAHERDPEVYMRGLRRAVQLVADGVIDPRSLYSHEVQLGRLGDAFQMMRERPQGFLKALVIP